MFGRIHQWLPAVVGIFGVSTAWAGTAYLPQAGPVPLRFRVPPPPLTQHLMAPVMAVAPPPPLRISLPTPPMSSSPPEMTNAAPAKALTPVPVTNGPPIEYNARESVSGPAPSATTDGVVSPQMLIKYFTAPTIAATNNAASVGVVAPVGFTPPPMATPGPMPPPSSQPAH